MEEFLERYWPLGCVGAVVGALFGYLFRPSVPLYGKLPFRHVISRGEFLSEEYNRLVEALLYKTAVESFEMLIAGGIIGALGALGITWLLANR